MQQKDLEAGVAGLLAGKGWAGFTVDDQPIKPRPITDEEYELAKSFKKVFGNTAGKKVIERLVGIAFVGTNFDPFTQDADKAAAQGFFKEGQKSLVREIMKMIEVADGPKPEAQEEADHG